MILEDPEFLDVEDVEGLHASLLERFGGAGGLRDRALLESAVGQARATFDGIFLHRDLFEMASAYLFHVVMNHPFVDGNKRTGLLAALVFLDLNGITIERETNRLHDLTIGVADGRLEKDEIARVLRDIATT